MNDERTERRNLCMIKGSDICHELAHLVFVYFILSELCMVGNIE